MHYTLTDGNQSNHQVTLSFTKEEVQSFKEPALKQFQKDTNIEGFRPGHAPLSLIEQRIQPEYLQVAIYEEALHHMTSKMLEEHADKKFIGQMYNLSIDDKQGDTISMSFLIDVYPDTSAKNSNWKKTALKPVENTATDAEVAETLHNLKKQYADYQTVPAVTEQSVFKVALTFLDKDGTVQNTGKLYLGKEDFDEFPLLKELFIGKQQDETVSIAYDEKKLPHTMHLHKEGMKADRIEAVVGDIRDMILPEFTPENIMKFFGSEDVQNEEELQVKIKALIEAQKEEQLLMQAIDSFLQEAMKSFGIVIPKTLIEEEVKTRMKSLQERMGGEEGLKKYFEQIGEEEVKKLQTNIQDAAKSSLEKFLALRAIVEDLEIKEINREAHLDVEKKLYAKLMEIQK